MTFRLAGAIIHLRFEFVLADLWVGVFHRKTPCQTDDGPKTMATDVWVCLVPCVPLHATVWWPVTIPFGGGTGP